MKNLEKWLNRNISSLDIDPVGQIDFIGTEFEYDQDSRIEIQKIYDEKCDD